MPPQVLNLFIPTIFFQLRNLFIYFKKWVYNGVLNMLTVDPDPSNPNPFIGYDDPQYHNHDPDEDVDEEWFQGRDGWD